MSLQSWVGDSLERSNTSPAGLRKLLDAAVRQLADARIAGVSAETRFSVAYTAIRLLADLGLQANGYRTLSSRAGHHQTAIHSLALTFGVDAATVSRLDAMRKQRNRTEYSADVVSEAQVTAGLKDADALLQTARVWLKMHKPQVLSGT